MVDRIERGSTANINIALTVGGTAQDPTPDSATVTITRSDGTALVTDTAAADSGTGVFSYQLTPDMTGLLDTLTATWTFTADGYEQSRTTYHEIVGGFLFTVGEFRALGTAYANTTNYPSSSIAAIRTAVEQALEDACGRAFVPRYTRETITAHDSTRLELTWPEVRSVRSVTVTSYGVATALTVSDLALLSYGASNRLMGYTWTGGYDPARVTVGYEHGLTSPPERIRRAALLLAKRWLTPSSTDDRAINVTNDTGTYALFQAGVRGHLFDLPEVQAAVDQYNLSAGVA